MNKLNITKANVGIIFDPRSGSHVLERYLANQLDLLVLGETFNVLAGGVLATNIYSKKLEFSQPFKNGVNTSEPEGFSENLNAKLDIIKAEPRNKIYKILPQSYLSFYPKFSSNLSTLPDTQFIQLKRADVLYSFISTLISQITDKWHNVTDKLYSRKGTGLITFTIPRLQDMLNSYITQEEHIKQYFPDTPIIFYEEFQFNINNLRKKFGNIPQRIIGTRFNKFEGNHKDLIENLDEVEDYYEQFVNEHKEYFPQYFNKLPHIKIPASQGRQPRDLSLNTSEETVS